MMNTKNIQSMICLVIFFLFANQAWSADWIYFDTAAVGDVYYDKNSIKKEDQNIILVWNKNILSEQAKTKYYSILKGMQKAPQSPSRLSYYKKLMQIDCVNRKIKDISVIFYDAKGKVIYSSPQGESGAWNDILPNTVGEKLINIVSCEPVPSKVATTQEAVIAPKVDTTKAATVVTSELNEPVTPSTFFAAYSGHVASFKSEDNAVIFVNKMKAKGHIAFYQKEDVKGQGDFYRVYIGRYKTKAGARKALNKLKRAGEIGYFKIHKMGEGKKAITIREKKIVAQKSKIIQKQKSKAVNTIDTRNYYKGIKGIVLMNGKVVYGQIISIDDDVIKIRLKQHGKILSYSFMKVQKYITD